MRCKHLRKPGSKRLIKENDKKRLKKEVRSSKVGGLAVGSIARNRPGAHSLIRNTSPPVVRNRKSQIQDLPLHEPNEEATEFSISHAMHECMTLYTAVPRPTVTSSV